ncbi:MAG TPA: hypothetical protein VFB08_15595 [Burkholderiales bacterium]|nr:hypothetical protein [Burkholderiales bacterium]
MKRKKSRQANKKKLAKRKASPTTPAREHRRGFDQLLDDAIFGVPKKPQKAA